MFKVGDRVRVKNFTARELETARHTHPNFITDMDRFIGKQVTISNIYESVFIEENTCAWNVNWFESKPSYIEATIVQSQR